ncbi:phosphoribosylanthranilate isomerase [Winogradskyella alexanderae]|uniref:N-(5'-phosphoribosyl)anthranilate isomerase n=1 Tax=Winogradskyella alexanderae TaxID=2877123 RepID=A0ABS7XVF7_9FLAO|nr:phosphoribosylanthranilate isomerase [Winogradskyella alexanderae]MCA0132892.1 phosphoribosylanthranilate isomerase [Winogradskyella alexanderae]
MKLKVCGMKYLNNMDAVSKLQPDLMGFIYYKKSSRYFQGELPSLPPSIKKVGVFVNEGIKKLKEIIAEQNLDIVQLHGDESPDYCSQIKGVEIIKVFSIKDQFDFDILKPYESVCDYYLFDTKGKLPGGNGYTFNWDLLKAYPSTKPFFLSGGIGLDEIEKINEFKESPASKYCYALDVNSKFEISPGVKNINELEKFKYELQH